MPNLFKRLISAVFPSFLSGGIILAYHSIDINDLGSTISPEEFERQMRYIKEKRLEVIALSELAFRLKEGRPVEGTVVITFDNGYSDFFKHAFPVLKRYNFSATVFLITGLLGKNIKMAEGRVTLPVMSEGDVRRAATNTLIEFMPATVSYPDLSKLSLEAALKEINSSRVAVEKMTRKPSDILAYPKGKYTKELLEHLKKSGDWFGAVTLESGHVREKDDLFCLKRVEVGSSLLLPEFKKKLSK